MSPHGKVVDESTEEPVVGAFVVAQFTGDGEYVLIDPGAGTWGYCYGSLVTMSDERGEFDFSRESPSRLFTSKYNRNLHVKITAYAPGYSHEKNEGYRSWLDDNLVFEKYVTAKLFGNIIKLTQEEKSAYFNRLDYLVTQQGFCGSGKIKTEKHWHMTREVLEETKQKAATSGDWRLAIHFCSIMNIMQKEFSLDVPVTNCSFFDETVRQVAKQEFLELQELLRTLEWDDGPRMELLRYHLAPMNRGLSVFVIPDKPQGLHTEDINNLLDKVCDSSYPGDFIMGSVCIYFGQEPPELNKDNSCHVFVRNNNMVINDGIGKGTSIKLEPEWCHRKKMPLYYWPDQL